jgi:peptidoglycan LD-endopeptidase LytH
MATFGAGLVLGAGGLYLALATDHLIPVQAAMVAPRPPVLPVAPPPAPTRVADDDVHLLLQHNLAPPILRVDAAKLQDTFVSARPGGKTHEAIDIPAPRGTPVHAVDDGTIARLTVSKTGGISIYQLDPQGAYCYYYAHLARYRNRLRAGMKVKHGDVIGYVGTTGDAPANGPHLHLAISRVAGELWEGAPIDPYPLLLAISPDPVDESY